MQPKCTSSLLPGAVALALAAAATLLSSCGSASDESINRITPPTYGVESPMTAAEVDIIIRRAAASVDSPNLNVAVVDRVGRLLGLWSRNPARTVDDLNFAVSLARTGAFMSSSQGPITSRTLEFISTFHFPPTFGALTRNPVPTASAFALDASLPSQHETTGIAYTGQGPLWQIYSCNRGAPYAGVDLVQAGAQTTPPTEFAAPTPPFSDMRLPPAARIAANGAPVVGVAGPGLCYLAGGVPAYKSGGSTGVDFPARVVGGVGVYITDVPGGVPDDQLAEFVAIRALGGITDEGAPKGLSNFAVPRSALAADEDLNFFFPYDIVPPQGLIYLVGILLPYTAAPVRPAGVGNGVFDPARTVVAATAGGQQPFGYLIGPRADPEPNGLTEADVRRIVDQGLAVANGTRAAIRVPNGSPTKMVFAVTNRSGLILAAFRMEDAPVFSYDVALTKARCVTYLSSSPGGNPDLALADQALLNLAGIPTAPGLGFALTTRTMGFLSQPFFPPGIVNNPTPGPLFALAAQNADPSRFNRMANAPARPGLQSGLIFFPGATSLWKNGELVGGFGVSGDGVEQDDFVTDGGSRGFEAPVERRADRFTLQGARLPYYKFPQVLGQGGG